jgi:Uma2 family endonuclease
MTAPVSPLTIDDFERLPDELAVNHELVDGELVDVSGDTPNHHSLRDELITMLLPYVTKHKLGSVICGQDYDFGGNALGPDLSFFGPEKLKLCEGNLRVQRFVPDLTIEIVSQNEPFVRLVEKADHYRDCGTKEAWILDIDSRRAFVFSGERAILDDSQQFQSSLIPGFSIRIGDLFDQL